MPMSHFINDIRSSLQSLRPRTLVLLIPLLLLPFLVGGLYYATQLRSKANVNVEVVNAKAVRISNVAAEISFQTTAAVDTTLQCAISRTGVKFFAGQDGEPSTQHLINTQKFNVTLNPNTAYYCYIYINSQQLPPELFVPASPLSRTFGIDASAFSNGVYGTCTGDEGFNPALDINQDGCILLNDLNEFPEY